MLHIHCSLTQKFRHFGANNNCCSLKECNKSKFDATSNLWQNVSNATHNPLAKLYSIGMIMLEHKINYYKRNN